MKARTKYEPLLTPLLKRPSFSVSDAEKAGIPRRILAYLTKTGDLERLGRGIYRSTTYEWDEDAMFEELVVVVSSVPSAVVCLLSALKYYELTEEIVRHHWIAIPNDQWAPSLLPHMRVVRMRNMTLGRTSIKIGEYDVAIFDRERCIIDAFRYLSQEIAIKSLKEYILASATKPDLRRLSEYSKKLRVNIDNHIASIIT